MIKKEQNNMELRACIFVILAISSLILYLSVEGLNILPSISQPNSRFTLLPKEQGLRVFDLAKEATQPPLAPVNVPKDAPSSGPAPASAPVSYVSEEALRKARDGTGRLVVSGPASSPVSIHGKKPPSPISLWDGLSSVLEEGRKRLGPAMLDETENALNPLSPSVLELGKRPSTPGPTTGPVADYEAETPGSNPNSIALPPSPSGFFDHDVALAIESRIKQSQSDAQLAMDEAKKLLSDPKIASSETGKCLSKCVEKYGASLNQLNTAITDLGVRDVTLLADDFSAVETDIGSCQACFSEKMGEDSPMKALEEATTKAARECLTVMDYAS